MVLADVPGPRNKGTRPERGCSWTPKNGTMVQKKTDRGNARENCPFTIPPFCFLSRIFGVSRLSPFLLKSIRAFSVMGLTFYAFYGHYYNSAQWARRDSLMSRDKNCRKTIFVSQLSRNHPRGGNYETRKKALFVGKRQFGRHFRRQFETIFAARHQDVSQGPLRD